MSNCSYSKYTSCALLYQVYNHDDNGLTETVAEAREMYGDMGGSHHLFELVSRLAAIEGLGISIEAGEDIERMTAWEDMQAELMRSLDGTMVGVTPWESEILRPAP